MMTDTEKKSGNILDTDRYANRFQRVVNVTPEGKKKYTRDVGDVVATALRGLTRDDLLQVVKENEGGQRIERYYDTLNHGQFRMTVGHYLRARLRRSEKVTVFGKEVLLPTAE